MTFFFRREVRFCYWGLGFDLHFTSFLEGVGFPVFEDSSISMSRNARANFIETKQSKHVPLRFDDVPKQVLQSAWQFGSCQMLTIGLHSRLAQQLGSTSRGFQWLWLASVGQPCS